jgi:hypothetical protein
MANRSLNLMDFPLADFPPAAISDALRYCFGNRCYTGIDKNKVNLFTIPNIEAGISRVLHYPHSGQPVTGIGNLFLYRSNIGQFHV